MRSEHPSACRPETTRYTDTARRGAVMDAWDIGRVERLLAEVRSLAADVGAAGVRVVVGAAAEQLYRAGIGGDRTAGDLATALHAALQQPAADRAAA